MKRAILVRQKINRLIPMLTEKSVKVSQSGTNAYVKYTRSGIPELINIPYIADDAGDKFLDAIEGFVDHEVGHVLFTDPKVLGKAGKAGVKSLHNIVEDTYVERMMTQFFSGSALNLSNVGQFYLTSFVDKNMKEKPDEKEVWLMVSAIRALSGQTVFSDYMEDKWGLVPDFDVFKEYAKEALPKISSSQEALDVALKLKELMEKPSEPSDDDEERHDEKSKDKSGSSDGDSGDESEDSDGEAEEPADGDSDGDEKSDEELEREGDKSEGEDCKDESDESSEPSETDVGESEEIPGKGSDTESTGSGAKSKSLWDEIEEKVKDFDDAISEEISKESVELLSRSAYKVFSKDYDIVGSFDGSACSDRMLKIMQDSVDHMLGPLQKDVERAVAARSRSVWSTGHRSGRLNASALSKLTAFGDDRCFKRRHENHSKDVAVSLLVDCSGSMMGEKIKAASQAAYGLGAVLDRMKITNEILGFTTGARIPVSRGASDERIEYSRILSLYIPVFKSFDERMTPEVKKRLAYLPHAPILSENVDGESVQIAAVRLHARKESRKILIVLSDGYPACPGDYSSLGPHLAAAVEEAEREGVEVLAIGIQSEAPKRFYKKNVVLNSISDLPTTVISQIKSLLLK